MSFCAKQTKMDKKNIEKELFTHGKVAADTGVSCNNSVAAKVHV